MSLKILIVEDAFTEADYLGLILTRAGHTITAIAKSVEHALNAIRKERPDMVMLDIFLKGDLTGIHLALTLGKQNIPFIYLSANSGAATLDAAKKTHPCGFLVKPFREKDILIALDIADYRNRQTREHRARQESLLAALLDGVVREAGSREQKVLLLAKGFQQFIPFDYLLIVMENPDRDEQLILCFQQIGLDQYRPIGLPTAQEEGARCRWIDSGYVSCSDIQMKTGADFRNACLKEGLSEIMRKQFAVQSSLSAVFPGQGGESSGLTFFSSSPEGFSGEHAELLQLLRGILTTVISNIRTQGGKAGSPATRNLFKAQHGQVRPEGIIGNSSRLLHVLEMVRQVAATSSTVLITGETGTGKEGIAMAIHRLSDRKDRSLIKINCAAIPAFLAESELFGHERGAFSDAIERRIGKFEQADGGTIFLDEIGELPLSVQSKLLRVLQEKEIERVGGTRPVKLDVRILAATNRDLQDEVACGRFRLDLYYRIHVFPIVVPALRERKEDIPLLAAHFLRSLARETGKPEKSIAPSALQQLMEYSWPGNIRQLQHVMERHSLVGPSNVIEQVDLPDEPVTDSDTIAPPGKSTAVSQEKEDIIDALNKCEGKISGKGGAAELLGINPNTFCSRMRKHGIRWKFI